MEKVPLLQNEEGLKMFCSVFSVTDSTPEENLCLLRVASGIAIGIVAATPCGVHTAKELLETLQKYIPERYLGAVSRLV
jgi:hypothetical protein